MRITLTGATGFIGKRLVAALLDRGDDLTILTRTPKAGNNPRYVAWDAAKSLEADAVIHLAGESVAQRWTAEVKQRIRASRIETTRALVAALERAPRKPQVLISASAIGIYGSRGDELLTETSKPGSGFLEDVCIEWERESQRAADLGIRVVNPRIGIVLGAGGGALERMLTPFKMGVGGRLGSGEQWMSWIHIADVVGLILFVLDHADLRGPMNATAPNPVRNADFTAELAAALHRPAVLTTPAFALKLAFGEMAAVILASQRVLPRVALDAGYQFQFQDLRPALEDIL